MNGWAKLTYGTGEVYEGKWVNGKMNGWGKRTLKNGVVVYEGEWQDDKKHGRGVMRYENGGKPF